MKIIMNSFQKYAALLILIVLAVYIPSLFNGFVNWDDDLLLTANQYVQTLDWAHVKDMFTTTVANTYVPLTSLSFAVEYHFVKDLAWVYHFNNALLHVAISVLVFLFANCLGLSKKASFFAAILFGIHPMHVESVAWITERKDVLYSFFYLLSVIAYLKYCGTITGKNNGILSNRWFQAVLFFGLLSVLSKSMALSLPLILLLCDWYLKRKFSVRLLYEKAILAALMLPIVWATYYLQMRPTGFMEEGSLLVWLWCLFFYIRKFFYPDYFAVIYGLPKNISLSNPQYAWAAVFAVVLIFMLVYFRKNRLGIFAFLYYLFSIFFILRYDNLVDANIVADRFMYLPSVGICMLAGSVTEWLYMVGEKMKIYRFATGFLYVLLFGILMQKTYKQIGVWRSGVSLWENQLEHEPNVATALSFEKLAGAYMESKDFDVSDQEKFRKIERLFKDAIDIKPDYSNAFWGLGKLYYQKKEYKKSEKYFLMAADGDRPHGWIFDSMGVLYFTTGDNEKSLGLFKRALEMNPDNELLRKKIKEFIKVNRLEDTGVN